MFHPQGFTRLCLLLIAGLGFAGTGRGAEPFEAFLEKHCVRCHGPEKKKGELRIDQLSRDFKSGVDTHRWAEVIERINAGAMPPKNEKRPTQDEIAEFVTKLDSRLKRGPGGADGGAAGGGALSTEPKRIPEHGL